MSDGFHIRPARNIDELSLGALVNDSHATFQGYLPDFFREFNTSSWPAKFNAMMNSDAFEVFVATTAHDKLVAFIILFHKQTSSEIVKPRHRIIIDNIFVVERYRRRGLGRALMAQAQKSARKRGCDLIELEVANSNQTALNLYAKLGFTIRTQTLELRPPTSD